MPLLLTEEQEAIRKTARDLVGERLPITQLRELRDGRDPVGYSRQAWRALAGHGLVGIPFSEAYGGAGLGYAELGIVLEECGRTLAATPFLSTVVLGGSAISLGGTEAQRSTHLPAIASGERVIAFAHEERSRHAPYAIATRAEHDSDGKLRLHGQKSFVLDGHIADFFVVVARSDGDETRRAGLSLFLVPARSAGISVEKLSLIDSRNVARVRFEGVQVSAEDRVGEAGQGAILVDALLDRARIAIAAEMLGAAQEAFGRTIAFLKGRKQFGVPIGSFQALKHRAARLFCELELTRSIVREALCAVDEGRAGVPELASAAKARATDTFLQVANEAIQMHGGIGVTDELDIGLFLKRARVGEMSFGDSAFHRDRYARLLRY